MIPHESVPYSAFFSFTLVFVVMIPRREVKSMHMGPTFIHAYSSPKTRE